MWTVWLEILVLRTDVCFKECDSSPGSQSADSHSQCCLFFWKSKYRISAKPRKHLENVCGNLLISALSRLPVTRSQCFTSAPRSTRTLTWPFWGLYSKVSGLTPVLSPSPPSPSSTAEQKSRKVDSLLLLLVSWDERFRTNVFLLIWICFGRPFPAARPSLCAPQEIVLLTFTGPPHSSTARSRAERGANQTVPTLF